MPQATINGKSVLFVHIPKTGGSSVEQFLASHGPLTLKGRKASGMPCSAQHLHADALVARDAHVGHDWVFTVVRHPVARLLSEYRYQMRKPRGLRRWLSFSAWLRYSLARRAMSSSYRDNHFRSQQEFLLPDIEVLRFEDGIDKCLTHVAGKIGVPVPVSTIHEKRSEPVNFDFKPADMERIFAAYEGDFAQFSYGTDEAALVAAGVVLSTQAPLSAL